VVNENGRAARMSPDGLTSGDCVVNPVTYGRDSAFPAPHAPCWSLIGRIGIKGGIFKVGARTVILAPSHGDLMLGVNDSDVAGNSGAWAVSATVTKGSGTPPKPGVDQLTLTSIDPSAISEKGTHKYTVQGIGLTKETTITLSVPSPAFAGSKSRLQDSRPADVSAGGTRITVYIYIGAQPGKSSIRVAARSASTATAFLDVPIKR